MIINSCCGGFVMIGGAATTGILCTQNQLRNTITTIDLSTLLSGYTSVGNFKTAPDFMGVLEQVKQNMIDGGATNVLSLNDVQLRSGTWNALSGCVIEPKNASVQYTGSATLS